ncbi:MAG: hypothetical protein ACO1RX_01570 [Candidatus Sericytochromatia bacterium]
MHESEQAALEALADSVRQIAVPWSDRSPTQLASVLQDSSLGVLLEVLSRQDDGPETPLLYEALAKLLLARYAREEGDLEAYRSELWAIAHQPDHRQWSLRELLQALLEITRQQTASHPSYQTYYALGLMAEEVLQELGQLITPYPRRRRRRLNVSLARTAELPDISSLTFEPVETRLESRRKTGMLTGLPASIVLPTRYNQPEWIVDWHNLDLAPGLQEPFLAHLPRLYALLENWDEQQSPPELAEMLQGLSPSLVLELSAALLPHPSQVSYLRYLGIWLHVQWLQRDLTDVNEIMRQQLTECSARVQALLPALHFYLYCSSYSFHGIQEQALKRLESRQGYLYHLIVQEWAKNKRIRSFVRTRLPRQEQLAVKLLTPQDWSFVFFMLNRGWARSVIRDVYGIFHGTSAFANQIVDSDTSRGFGNLRESSGVSFLATRQISELLRKQTRQQPDANTRLQHFEAFVEERFRKDVLRREQRPNLNTPTLKRLERMIGALQQRATQEDIAPALTTRLGSTEILRAYTYLSSERMAWLGYELVRMWLAPLTQLHEVEAVLLGFLQALLGQMEHAFSHRREAAELLAALLQSVLDALLDHAVFSRFSPGQVRELPGLLARLLQEQAPAALQPLYRQYMLQQQGLSSSPAHAP